MTIQVRTHRTSLQVDGGNVFIDGSPVFVGSRQELLALLEKAASGDTVELLITSNVDQVITLEADPLWREVFSKAAIRIADGAPLVFLARVLGHRNAQRHTGADLLPLIAELSAQRGWKIAITGGDYDTTRRAAAKLADRFSGASITSVRFPSIQEVADDRTREVVRSLKTLRPDFVFVCLGAPKQEKWVLEWQHELPPALYIGAGAAVEFAAATRRRAPHWVQNIGFEWVWRLVQEPRRLATRYLVKGPRFLRIALRSVRHSKWAGSK